MTGEIIFVLALIVISAVLMASNKLRFDVIALMVVLALILSGILSVREALAGFGSSVVILVGCLLVVGEMLDRTGVARSVGDLILKKGGKSETRLVIVIMAGAAILGSVMSSTAIVAIFIPIVLRIAAETNMNASKLLIPVSYAALISGMLTLIATPPNLVVSEELVVAGYKGFSFFSFTLIGLAILVTAILYILFIGRKFLPDMAEQTGTGSTQRSMASLWEDYRADTQFSFLQISVDSPLVGMTLEESELNQRHKSRIVALMRTGKEKKERAVATEPGTILQVGDMLLAVSTETLESSLLQEKGLIQKPLTDSYLQQWIWELGTAAVMIHPESSLLGKSLCDAEFHSRNGLNVIGLRRGKEAVSDFQDIKLATADSLLVVGPWSRIQQLQSRTHDFVVLETPSEQKDIVPAYQKKPVALGILGIMVLLSILDVIPLVAVVIIAALAGVATRCLTMEDSYRAIHWSSLVLVAGMLPLADALAKTGGTDLLVNAMMTTFGEAGPRVVLTVIFFLTAGMSLFLSNTASAVLVAPIAISAAEKMALSPYPFGIAVIIAASAAFSTPVASPVVTLVVEPGRYQFSDFVKVGVPLLFLTYLVTVLLAPLIFPF